MEEGIACHCQALDFRPHSHPNRSSSLNNLGNAVCTRYIQLGRMEDLEEVIKCYRQALALRVFPHSHPNHSVTSPLPCTRALLYVQRGRTL